MVPKTRLICGYRIGHLGGPIVRHSEETLKPLYRGDYLFDIHTVAPLYYSAMLEAAK